MRGVAFAVARGVWVGGARADSRPKFTKFTLVAGLHVAFADAVTGGLSPKFTKFTLVAGLRVMFADAVTGGLSPKVH